MACEQVCRNMNIPSSFVLNNAEILRNQTRILNCNEMRNSEKMQSNSLQSLPEYQNLINIETSLNTEHLPVIVQPSNNKSNSLVHCTRSLPPRPVPLPRKSPKCKTPGLCDNMKFANGGRCISPSPSVISNVSNCSQQSSMLLRKRHSSRASSIISTLRRPHVSHRKCSLNSIQLEKLSSDGPQVDIAIIYSKKCQVSADWARYFDSMFKGAHYGLTQLPTKNDSYARTTTCDNVNNQFVRVQLQEIEEFSSKVYEMNSSTSRER